MRYLAMCSSMLLDQVEVLEYQRAEIVKSASNLEVVMEKILGRQDELHTKVGDQDANIQASS